MFFSSELTLTITDTTLSTVTSCCTCSYMELNERNNMFSIVIYPPGGWWRSKWKNFKLRTYEDKKQIEKLIEFLLYLRGEGHFMAKHPGPYKHAKLEMCVTADKVTISVIDPINSEITYDFKVNAEEVI